MLSFEYSQAAMCGVSVTHQRSAQAQIRRLARRYVLNTAYRDFVQAESVCRCSRPDILNYVCSFSSDGVQLSEIPNVQKGLVLVDSRGRGAFQA